MIKVVVLIKVSVTIIVIGSSSSFSNRITPVISLDFLGCSIFFTVWLKVLVNGDHLGGVSLILDESSGDFTSLKAESNTERSVTIDIFSVNIGTLFDHVDCRNSRVLLSSIMESSLTKIIFSIDLNSGLIA